MRAEEHSNNSNSDRMKGKHMKHETDNQTALAALPASFNPIANPPGWTKPTDLELYAAAWRPEEAPVLPANATLEEAYAHAHKLLRSAVTELSVCLAMRAVFNAGQIDPQCVHELRSKPRHELIERFRAVDIAQTRRDFDTATAADVVIYVNEQADEAAFLHEAHERLMNCHTWQPGYVSLCEIHALTKRIGGLACRLAEDYWNSEAFGDLFDEVADSLRPGCLFLYTSPEPGTCMRSLWRRAENNEDKEQ